MIGSLLQEKPSVLLHAHQRVNDKDSVWIGPSLPSLNKLTQVPVPIWCYLSPSLMMHNGLINISSFVRSQLLAK